MPRYGIHLIATILAGVAVVGNCARSQFSGPTSQQVKTDSLNGYWYMGTMTGQDCDLESKNNGTLRVRRGGCFSTGPWIESTWSRNGDKIIINTPGLRNDIGAFLVITKYKSNIILVPESSQSLIKTRRFPADKCFWVNRLGDAGLELSKDYGDFEM